MLWSEVSADSCKLTIVMITSDAGTHALRQMPSPSVVFGLQVVMVSDESPGLVSVSLKYL